MNELKKAGYTVGEISGRKYSLDIKTEQDTELDHMTGVINVRDRKKSDITHLVQEYNSGDTDVVIINKAAATGLSMHASPRFKNQNQRHLIEVESDPNPNVRLQLFGRVNRFDQVVAPIISMMSLGLPSELRNIMMQNKKLQNLSANIRSSRENAAINQNVPDFLNPTGDRVCQEYLLENSGISNRLGIEISQLDKSYGLASRLTQRLALLEPAHQERIFADLTAAYEDAVNEEEISDSRRDIPVKDLRAKTIETHHAWGPKNLNLGSSVFDAPVKQRLISFNQNHNPLHWNEIVDKMELSANALLSDHRVKLKKADPLAAKGRYVVTQSDLAQEIAQVNAEKMLFPFAIMNQVIENDLLTNSLGKKIAITLPVIGSNHNQHALMLISKSGKSAKVWTFVQPNRDQANAAPIEKTHSFLIDLSEIKQFSKKFDELPNARNGADKPIQINYLVNHGGTALLRDLIGTVKTPPFSTPTSSEWINKAAIETFNSTEAKVPVLDIDDAIQAAINGFETKKIIGLSSVKDADSVESALELPTHNTVKEAHFRSLFVQNVLNKLSIGSLISAEPQCIPRRFSRFFAGNTLLITGIALPEQGHESSLTKWKIQIARYGDEKTYTLSAATLLKIAGEAPYNNLNIDSRNILSIGNDRQKKRTGDSFNLFSKGQRVETKALLTGNIYQASQWAKASRQGSPIIYTDEHGNLNRAIEIDRSALHFGRLLSISNRLHDTVSVKNLLTHLFENKNEIEYAPNVPHDRHFFARTLESAIKNHSDLMKGDGEFSGDGVLPNTVRVITTGDGVETSHAIDITLPKHDRTSLRKRMIDALTNAKAEWNDQDLPYLGLEPEYHRIDTIRGSARLEHRTLRIVIPSGNDDMSKLARSQILDAFIYAHGSELISIPFYATTARLLNEELERYYDRVSQPDVEMHNKLIERFAKRKEHKLMMDTAFNEGEQQNITAQPISTDLPVSIEQDTQSEDQYDSQDYQDNYSLDLFSPSPSN